MEEGKREREREALMMVQLTFQLKVHGKLKEEER